MKTKLLSTAICLLAFLSALVMPVFADFGNFDTYDSGWSDSDWGSSFDSDWDSSYDSSYGGGYYGGSFYHDDGDGDGEDIPIYVIVIIVAVVIAVAVMKSKLGGTGGAVGSGASRMNTSGGTVVVPVRGSYANKTSEIEQAIAAYDPEFTSGKLLGLVKESYVKFQAAWTKRDLEELRLLQSEELFSQSRMQIEEYIRLGRINVMERVAVNNAYFVDHRIDNSKEYIDVFLTATQKDYIIDEKTKQVLEGSPNSYRQMSYIITVMRTEGEKTPASDLSDASAGVDAKAANCPNCGAPLEITAAGKCAYCDSVISSDSHSWVISAMRRA